LPCTLALLHAQILAAAARLLIQNNTRRKSFNNIAIAVALLAQPR
jgi:hypothetical protein